MPGDSSLFDIPPPTFGRYRVQHQIGVGAKGPVFRGEDADTKAPVAIKALRIHLPIDLSTQVSDDLIALVDRAPSHPALVPLRAAGLEQQEPYLVSDVAPGEPLDQALKRYGPGAIVDLIPRVRSIAEALDKAAAFGLFHGALHPRDVMVSADSTVLTGVGVAPILAVTGSGFPVRRPYSAPEIVNGDPCSSASDQFALAAITFEWLFGQSVSGPAYSPLEAPALPNADRDRLSDAFTRALSSNPSARFPDCRSFVHAVTAAVPVLAKAMVVDHVADAPIRRESEPISAWDDDGDLDHPIILEDKTGTDLKLLDLTHPLPAPLEPIRVTPPDFSAAPMFATSRREPQRFGLGALGATLVLGMVVGLAGGYVASVRLWPQAAQAVVSPMPAPLVERKAPVAAPPAVEPEPKKVATIEPKPEIGHLLVRSTPAGATVQIDGVMRGVTPLALTDVELGSRTVSLSRLGYLAEERRVLLTTSRPSRALEVRLSLGASAPVPRPAAPTTAATRPAVRETGSLVVDSRPIGAAVAVNGVPRGRTPVTVDNLPPGDYTVTMMLTRFRPISMTVHVAAGARARAAASLTLANEQEKE